MFETYNIPHDELNAAVLHQLVDAVMQSLHAGNLITHNWAVNDLEAHLSELEIMCYRLNNQGMLETWLWIGHNALVTLRSMEQGLPHHRPYRLMLDALAAAKQSPHDAGAILQPLVDYVCTAVNVTV